MKKLLESRGWTVSGRCNCSPLATYYQHRDFPEAQIEVMEKNPWYRIKKNRQIVSRLGWRESKYMESEMIKLELWTKPALS